MKALDNFLIPFIGLKLGKHHFDFSIDKSFFESYQYDEFEDVAANVQLVLDKKSTHLELFFQHQTKVLVPCDVTNEMFWLPLKSKLNIIVKFGEEYNDTHDEILILPHGEFQIHVAQYIYEMIVLSVPAKRVHPGIADGTLKHEALNHLYQSNNQSPIEEETQETDPRWDKLRELLTDKKK